jgi:hypothetical protein
LRSSRSSGGTRAQERTSRECWRFHRHQHIQPSHDTKMLPGTKPDRSPTQAAHKRGESVSIGCEAYGLSVRENHCGANISLRIRRSSTARLLTLLGWVTL